MCEDAEIETENRKYNILAILYQYILILANFFRRSECFVKVLELFLQGIVASKKDNCNHTWLSICSTIALSLNLYLCLKFFHLLLVSQRGEKEDISNSVFRVQRLQ